MKTMNTTKQSTSKDAIIAGRQRSYNEIVEYLDAHWQTNKNAADLAVIKQLDKSFDSVSQKLDTIVINGTNGKSITAHFTAKLLQEEGLTVGTFYSPHILTYNERFIINDESISNKAFTDIGNEVINSAESLQLEANSYDILTMMSFLYFSKNNVDIVLLEVSEGGTHNAVSISTPKIVAITRIADPDIITDSPETKALIVEITGVIKKDTHVVSADQSKLNLQIMQDLTMQKGGQWAMPIRKLASLPYPYEQLHGRCAALAERIAFIYINNFANKNSVIVNASILTKQKGQRGRPTLEAKRQLDLHPKKTLDQFWKDTVNNLPGRFQIFDKEKPTILLDNASNIDAFKNILLGIRLLHYQRPLKGLTIVLGCNDNTIDIPELLKLLRYFFKKTSGQVIVCAIDPLPGHKGDSAWDVDKIANDIKSMKIKARGAHSFKEAFEAAQATVDERHGLVIITGSQSIVTEYWKYKGIKKL